MYSQLDSTAHIIQGPTPEFLRWALEQPCPLRTNARWQDPEQAERQLRPIREYSLAAEEGRVFEGICVSPSVDKNGPLENDACGFRVSEVLETYGGEAFVKSTCGNCAANVTSHDHELAGCHGWFEVEGLGEPFHESVADTIEQLGLGTDIRERFVVTRPWWYGLWINSPLNSTESRLLMKLFDAVSSKRPDLVHRFSQFRQALKASTDHSLRLFVNLNPRGIASEDGWQLVVHCPRCKVELSNTQLLCSTCGRTGQPNPSRLRHARGSRPYWPLKRFLGENEVNPFLRRYIRSRNLSGHPLS